MKTRIKMFQKITITILMIIMLFSANFSSVYAADVSIDQVENAAKRFSNIGDGMIDNMHIDVIQLADPLIVLYTIIHLALITAALINLVRVLMGIIGDNAPKEAEDKKRLPYALIILALAIVGLPWLRTILSWI